MQYRKMKDGTQVSILGYGCMRFSTTGGRIDIDKTEKEILLAIENGVNYFDTAYIYNGSEEALGTILARNHCRDKVNIATKLPYYLLKNTSSVEKLFQEQLKRLRTDHVDFYLMHMLFDLNVWNRLKSIGIEEWIAEKKQNGQIRNIGFSFHGDTKTFKELIDAYDWDFCQIQYNYLDEHAQAGRVGLEYAGQKGIPVVIMEPLRGGRLVNYLPPEAKKLIQKDGTFGSPAELALSWLWDQPEVTCVLSGMNSVDMIRENIHMAERAQASMMTERQLELVEQVKDEIRKKMKVGCTGCGYCMPCPNKVDIPMAFQCYNVKYAEGKHSGMWEYVQSTAMRHETSSASQCIGCGKCELHCPQSIPIREKLKEAVKELETPKYRIIKWAVKTFHIY